MKEICGFAILAACALAGCTRSGASDQKVDDRALMLEVEFTPVGRMPIQTTLDLVGTLLPVRGTTIVADVDGIIKSLPDSSRNLEFEDGGRRISVPLGLDLGHAVREGDPLVQIDPVDFQLALNVAKANCELAKRNLDELKAWKRSEELQQLEAALEEADATADLAQADLDRAKQLLGKKAVSQGDYDTSEMAWRTAQAAKRQAEAALALAKAGPTAEQVAVAEARVFAAQAEVERLQEKLAKTTVRAPYDAIITDRFVSVGDRVTAMPRVEIMRIMDPRVLFAQVDVPERFQRQIKLDGTASVRAAGIEEPFPARVEIINAAVDPETRTFRVRLTIDNRKGILKAGGFVHVDLPVATASDVVTAPRRALSFTEGHPAVFVFEPTEGRRAAVSDTAEGGRAAGVGRVKRVPVELGVSNDQAYEIVSGPSPGAMIAVDKILLLSDGLPVRRRAEATR
jgi:HlyD family secretion protein